MELAFLLVWKMRQNIEFQKSRSMVQALMSQTGAQTENITKAFDDLKEAFFPHDKTNKKIEIKHMREQLNKAMAKGPLSITPMSDPNEKKTKPRLERGQAELRRHAAMSETGKLSKLDKASPVRKRK